MRYSISILKSAALFMLWLMPGSQGMAQDDTDSAGLQSGMRMKMEKPVLTAIILLSPIPLIGIPRPRTLQAAPGYIWKKAVMDISIHRKVM